MTKVTIDKILGSPLMHEHDLSALTMFIGTTEHALTVIFSFATNIILVRTGIISDSE